MDIRGYRTAALRTHYQQHRQFPAQNRGIMGHVTNCFIRTNYQSS